MKTGHSGPFLPAVLKKKNWDNQAWEHLESPVKYTWCSIICGVGGWCLKINSYFPALFVEKQLDDERACGPLNCPHSEAYLLDRVGGSFKHVPPLGL